MDLAPSIAGAENHVRTRSLTADASTVADVIAQHHRLRAVRHGAAADVVEAFRRADLWDVSWGLLGGGADRAFVRELRGAFPDAGFHALLLRTGLAWFVRHPTRPLPMLRF